MSNAVKEPYNSPELYGPKKPEIVSLAAFAIKQKEIDKYTVIPSNGGSYIDGIPRLKWGEGKDSSFCGCITAALNAMGYGISYEEVMGLSGVCFQIIIRNDWDPSSEMPQNGLLCEKNIGDALGIDVYSLGSEAEIHRQTQVSIDNGIPVLLVGGRAEPEWTIVCGYQIKNGEAKYFGRTYFDYQNEMGINNTVSNQPAEVARDEKFTANNYYLFNAFPGVFPDALSRFYNRSCDPISLKQALKVSLETCIKMFEQSPGEYHNYGYDAYDSFISGFSLDDNEYERRCCCDQYHIGCLQDARRAAYMYLQKSAALLSGENQDKLLHAASLYKKMYKNLTDAIPYEKTTEVFNICSKPVWSKEIRVTLVSALTENKALEKQVRVIIRDLLDKWQ